LRFCLELIMQERVPINLDTRHFERAYENVIKFDLSSCMITCCSGCIGSHGASSLKRCVYKYSFMPILPVGRMARNVIIENDSMLVLQPEIPDLICNFMRWPRILIVMMQLC
jgi:hypothetical protein